MRRLVIGNTSYGLNPLEALYKLQADLRNGKLERIIDQGDNIKVTCPEHANGHESRPSCFINVNKDEVPFMYAHCFTCGLQCNFTTFISKAFECSENKAIQWLQDNFEYTYSKPSLNLEDINLNKFKQKQNNISIDKFENYHPYMTQRKLTGDIIKRYDIKYDAQTQCLVFPVKNKDGKIIFLTRRSVNNKSFIIDKNADKSNLYGLDQVYNKDNIYIVESQINCLTLAGWGYNSLATFGCGCPFDQIEALNKLPAKHLIIAFDNDPAGNEGTKKLCKYLSKSKFVDVVKFNDSRDINDLTKEEFESLRLIDRYNLV